jgi:2-polyprenyl-3-methyl-5-hydroxy-6-metoxy-1,4-benzoquinol methylase
VSSARATWLLACELRSTEAGPRTPHCTTSTETQMDVKQVFDKFNSMIGDATVLSVVAVLDKLGVFGAMRGKGALSIEQVSNLTNGLDNRHLQEALSAMACAGIMDYDATKETFTFPDAQATVLVDNQGPAHPLCLIGMVEALAGMYMIIPRVAEGFKTGSGVPFSNFPIEIIQGMGRSNGGAAESLLVRKWLPQMGLADVFSKASELHVADVGCGGGSAILALAKAYPHLKLVGIDVDERSLEIARSKAKQRGIRMKDEGGNVDFRQGNVMKDDKSTRELFDVVFSFDVIHDLSRPLEGLSSIKSLLNPRHGIYVMIEPNVASSLAENVDLGPPAAALYATSLMHCLTQSKSSPGSAALGACWGPREAEKWVLEAGFSTFERLPVKNASNAFYGVSNLREPIETTMQRLATRTSSKL